MEIGEHGAKQRLVARGPACHVVWDVVNGVHEIREELSLFGGKTGVSTPVTEEACLQTGGVQDGQAREEL